MIRIYTTAVIETSTENVTITYCISVFPNRKPWMRLRLSRTKAMQNSDWETERCSTARHKLTKGIKGAKAANKEEKTKEQMWHGMQRITDYRRNCLTSTNKSTSCVEELTTGRHIIAD